MIESKIKSQGELEKVVIKLRASKKKIISTNGVFDILHAGHVIYLEKAKRLGDTLIVGVNSDSSARKNKGDKRPINDQMARCKVLSALESVDFVFVFDEKDPRAWISKIKPDIHVKAGDYNAKQMIEYDTVLQNGGKVRIIPFEKGYSTSGTIEKILGAYKDN